MNTAYFIGVIDENRYQCLYDSDSRGIITIIVISISWSTEKVTFQDILMIVDREYLTNTGFPASVNTKYCRGKNLVSAMQIKRSVL